MSNVLKNRNAEPPKLETAEVEADGEQTSVPHKTDARYTDVSCQQTHSKSLTSR